MAEKTADKKVEFKAPTQPITVTLNHPLTAHGEEHTQLTFRLPTGEDMMEIGYPINIKMDGGKFGGVTVMKEEMAGMIAALAGIPPSSLKKMHYTDYAKCIGAVNAFFMPSLIDLYLTGISI